MSLTTSLKTLRTTIASTLFVALVGVSAQAYATQQLTPIAAIEYAGQTLDLNSLTQHTQQAQGDYEFAFAQYQLAVTASIHKQESTLQTALKQAADRLEMLVKSEPSPDETVEALALLASVRGMQAGYSPIQGAYYGKLSRNAIAQAKKLQPNHPRVLLIDGILAYQTPALFGGSTQTALNQLNAAVQAFSQPCQQICWGEAEALVWRGLARSAAGDTTGAKADWSQALVLAPDYAWAKKLNQGS